MLEVAAALIREQNRFLICKRPSSKANGDLWEFPGGKLEPGETAAQAVVRECREELGVTLSANESPIAQIEHTSGALSIHLMLHEAVIISGTLTLFEHSDARWITPSEAGLYDLCPGDRHLISILFNSAT